MMRLHLMGPAAPLLADAGTVHVWLAGLTMTEATLAALRPTLSREEREQAGRFVFERDRLAYEASHIALRQVLAPYADLEPSGIEFEIGHRGKPHLKGGPGDLHFNMSHAGGFALIGVRRGAPLGVDIEAIRPMDDMETLARQCFAPSEVAELQGLPGDERLEAFFNCWTRKEAYIKAIGEGLSCPLESFDVSLAPADPPRIRTIDGSREAASGWTLHAFTPAPQMVAALAAEGRLHTVVCGWCLEPRRMHAAV